MHIARKDPEDDFLIYEYLGGKLIDRERHHTTFTLCGKVKPPYGSVISSSAVTRA
jgi:hypothetical protein